MKDLGEASSQLASRYGFLLNLELVLLLLLATVFYVLYTHRWMDPFAGTVVYFAAGLVVLFMPVRLLVRASSKLRALRKITAYYEARMRRMEGRWSGSGDEGSDFFLPDHPYCADLDITGRGSLFEYLCSAQTGAGREWLADALLSPASTANVIAQQEAIGELRGREDLREYFASAEDAGVSVFQGKSLRAWCEEPPVLFSTFIRISAACLCAINLFTITLALSSRLTPEAPLATLAAVGLFTAALHRRAAQVIERTDSMVLHELVLLMAYTRRLRKEHFESTLLRDITRSFTCSQIVVCETCCGSCGC